MWSAALLGVVAAGAAVACGQKAAPPPSPVLAEIHVGRDAGPPLVAAGSVWVPNHADGTVSRVDPRSNRVVATIRIGDVAALQARRCGPDSVHSFMRDTLDNRRCDLPSDLATDGQRVWAVDNATDAIVRIDPGTNQVAQRIAVGDAPFHLAYGYGSLWVTNIFANPHSVIRVDPATGRRLASITGLPNGGTGIAVGAGGVWVAATYAQALVRIDPRNNAVAAVIPVEQYPLAVAVTAGSVWVRNEDSSSISRVDPGSNRVIASVHAPPPVGDSGVDALATGPDGLWVTGVTLQRIDPATNRAASLVDLSGDGASEGFGSLWMISVAGTLQRVNLRGPRWPYA